jgi:hypothetical protein
VEETAMLSRRALSILIGLVLVPVPVALALAGEDDGPPELAAMSNPDDPPTRAERAQYGELLRQATELPDGDDDPSTRLAELPDGTQISINLSGSPHTLRDLTLDELAVKWYGASEASDGHQRR